MIGIKAATTATGQNEDERDIGVDPAAGWSDGSVCGQFEGELGRAPGLQLFGCWWVLSGRVPMIENFVHEFLTNRILAANMMLLSELL